MLTKDNLDEEVSNVKREKAHLLVLMETTAEGVIRTQLNSHNAGKF